MMRMLLAMVLASLAFPAPALAFVCTRVSDADGNETGPSLSWFWRDGGRSLRFMVQQDGTEDISGSKRFGV